MDKPAFDLEQVYDDQIFPHMEAILKICKEHNLPFVATFQYNSEGDFCSSACLPKERPIEPQLEQIYSILQPKRAPMMMLTTRNKDGEITQMTAIVP